MLIYAQHTQKDLH